MEIEYTISAKEAGEMLGVSAKTICRRCDELGIKPVESGKRLVYRLTRKNFERVKKSIEGKSHEA